MLFVPDGAPNADKPVPVKGAMQPCRGDPDDPGVCVFTLQAGLGVEAVGAAAVL